MNEYTEDYSEVPAEEAATSDELQEGPDSYDTTVPGEDGSAQQEDSPSANSDTPHIEEVRRDLYGRYGDVNRQMQDQSRQLQDMTGKLGELASALENSNTRGSGGSGNIYDSMDADQKTAATRLVEEHPIVQELREFKNNIVSRQTEMERSQVTDNQSKLASAVEGLREQHGSKIAEAVGQDLYQVAELAQWNLNHPYFMTRLQAHQSRLEGNGKTKQQERQRATSERGGARSSGGRLPSAKRKSPDGKEYYSFAAAADIAEKIAAEQRNK